MPQDPADLVKLMGGQQAASERLDDFFAYDKLLTDPEGTVRNDWIEATYAYYSKPTYNPNNEPDLLAPYMYAWVREPAKTATVTRAAYTLFNPGPDGMTGNDDLGTMSAWYVMSSWGLHPPMSGANYFVVSSPQFERTDITVAARRQGRHARAAQLTITAPGVSDDRRYVQSLTVNGSRTTKSWVGWDALRSGGSLQHVVGDAPSSWGTRPSDVPPSVSTSKGSSKVSLSMSVKPNPLVLGDRRDLRQVRRRPRRAGPEEPAGARSRSASRRAGPPQPRSNRRRAQEQRRAGVGVGPGDPRPAGGRGAG